MEISILGTSSSLMRNGYVKALSLKHNVDNISAGRNSIFYHINTLIKEKNRINTSDILIIDHYLNDINFYINRDIKDYKIHVSNFYLMCKSLAVFPLVLFLPEIVEKSQLKEDYICYLKELLDSLGIQWIDFNQFNFQDHHFKDPVHLEQNVSFVLGMLLGHELLKNVDSIKKTIEGQLYSFPYFRIDAEYLNQNHGIDILNFENSMMNKSYIEVNDKTDLNIQLTDKMRLLSYGYLNLHDEFTSFLLRVNNKEIGVLCNDFKYFHEAIFDDDIFDGILNFNVSLNNSNNSVSSIRQAERSDIFSKNCNLVEFLFFKSNQEGIKAKYSNYSFLTMDMSELNYYLDFVFARTDTYLYLIEQIEVVDDMQFFISLNHAFNKNKYFTARKILNKNRRLFLEKVELASISMPVVALQNMAIILEEKSEINNAYELMVVAKKLRPLSPFIKGKLQQYKSLMTQ